jgi:hypothetical protein
MSVSILPLIGAGGQRTVSDAWLEEVWWRIVGEGKVEAVFYSGGVSSPNDFLRFVAANDRFMVFSLEGVSGRPRGFAWLTNLHDGSGFLHYCSLGGFGREQARLLMSHWEGLRNADGSPTVERLLGITPEANPAAVRVLKLMGFTTLGTIPGYCRLAHGGGRCGGVISFFEFRRAGHGAAGSPPLP